MRGDVWKLTKCEVEQVGAGRGGQGEARCGGRNSWSPGIWWAVDWHSWLIGATGDWELGVGQGQSRGGGLSAPPAASVSPPQSPWVGPFQLWALPAMVFSLFFLLVLSHF